MGRLLSRWLVAVVVCAAVVVGGILAQTERVAEPNFAYAHVTGEGQLDLANSKNVIAIGGGDGLYCFKLAFTPKNAVATIADDPTAPNQGLSFIETAVPPTPLFTCSTIPNPDGVVETANETAIGSGESAGGHAFYVYWKK